MDVITLSSDSDETVDEYIVKNTSLPGTSNWYDEVYTVEWDPDDVHPSIEYDSESQDKDLGQSSQGEEIEDFITPMKQGERVFDNNKGSEGLHTVGSTCVINNLKNKVKTNTLSTDINTQSCFSSDNFNLQITSPNKRRSPKLTPEEKEKTRILKEQNKLTKEKLREEKKIEQLRQKALKAAFAENRRNLKPEENIKFFKVHIDNDIINAPFGGNIISHLQQNNIQYVVESQKKNYTVLWTKKKVEKTVDDFGGLTEKIENKEENQLLYVLDWQNAVELIHRNEFLTHVQTVTSAYIDKRLTLIIYGLEKYFNYKKNKSHCDKKSKKKEYGKIFEDVPYISREELEFALIDLQLLGKHNTRLLETPEELSALIHNITKSLSQVDLKLDKQERQDDLGWVAVSSNQSVKVDKNGEGLLQLWQRQICQFNAVGLETAQAIVSQYNSPLALLTQYKKCSTSEGELLLQNIQIRRNGGILSSSRRIGPQLSKKMYKFFTSDNPDMEL